MVTTQAETVRTKAGKVYLWTTGAFLLLVFLVPPWKGFFYNKDVVSPAWFPGGTFGLDANFAPVFWPPRAYSDSIQATVRYPWQSISAHEHVEVNLPTMAFVLAVGLAALGIVARLWSAAESPGHPEPIVRFAFALAISQLVSILAIFVYALASLFSGDDRFVWIIPLVCGMIGSLVGLWQVSRGVEGQAPNET